MYVNYLGIEDVDRLRAAFGPNLERLMEIKSRHDPRGIFTGIPVPS
jgi:hypothetical protein